MTTIGGPINAGTKVGTSIGGPTKTTSIGGPKPGTTIGRQPKSSGTSIGGPTNNAATTIGQPKSGTDNSIGESTEKDAGTTIGNEQPKQQTGTTIGGQPKSSGTSIGGPTKTTSIGGPPKSSKTDVGGPKNATTPTTGTSIGGPEQNTKTTIGDTDSKPKEDEGESSGEEEGAQGTKKRKRRKKKTPATTETQAAAPEKSKTTKKPQISAAARQIKKMQDEQERLRKEDEERKRRIEEEERLKKEKERLEEEERLRKIEVTKKAREEAKVKQKEVEDKKVREAKIARYGMDPSLIPGLRGGRIASSGRNKKGRAGRGGRKTDEKQKEDDQPQKQGEEKKEPEPIVSPDTTMTDNVSPNMEDNKADNWEDIEDWENVEIKQEEEDWEMIEENNKEEPPPPKIEQTPSVPISPPSEKTTPSSEKTTSPLDEPKKKEKLTKAEEKKRLQQLKKEEQKKIMEENLNKTKLRSPICCVLGHVDTGKTLLLDKMRSSNVQAGEAGGITQQIGATFFPLSMIQNMTSKLEVSLKKQITYKLPGLLVIDTPGHESFTNLRSRGSSLCDIAILVVDIMHGLEPQTRESIRLLKNRRTPFVIALNKVDRLYGWKSVTDNPIKDSLSAQENYTKLEFEDRVKSTIADLAGEELNAEIYFRNKEIRKVVSLVPTSAVTGEGIPDLLLLLTQLAQNLMADRLLELSRLDCTVLEVKKLPGHGTTLDVILANGILKQGDKIMVCGLNGDPIITAIKAILMPPVATELRVNKSDYIQVKQVKAAIGCKIDAAGIDDAVAGSPLFVINPGDDIEFYKEKVTKSLTYLEGKIDKSGVGVYVQASTLGSMEALLEFLKEDCKIPVSGIRIGPVHKRDVMRASVMLEKEKPEYAVILAFDVKVTPEAREMADKCGVKIFEADIIYHLFDAFKSYTEQVQEEKLKGAKNILIFPCILRILGKEYVFNSRDPIICGVKVEEGILRTGTPIVVIVKTEGDDGKKMLELGKITKIERDKDVEIHEAKVDEEVSICISVDFGKQKYAYGRHFFETDLLYSHITRESIDALKEFHEDLVKQKEIYYCIVNLKRILSIQ